MTILLALAGGILLSYVLLVGALLVARPESATVSSALRLLPDLLRLIRRLGADTSLPRGARARLWLLIAYLAMPFDLIPDFIPVLGYADDVILISLVLRSVIRRAGPQTVERHWPGTPDGLRAIHLLAGLDHATA